MKMLHLNNLCDYAGSNLQERKFIEGHRIYCTKNNIFECGTVDDNEPNLKIKALCLKTSHLQDGFHEINGEIKTDGAIIGFICSCPAGNSGQCKHIIGTLFHCLYSSDLKKLSCTDTACSWNKNYKEALVNYKPLALEQHPCFSDLPSVTENKLANVMSKMKIQSTTDSSNCQTSNLQDITNQMELKVKNIKRVKPADDVTEEESKRIQELFSGLQNSALVVAAKGRHESVKRKDNTIVTNHEKEIYKLIFENQDSNLMEMVKLFSVNPLKDCCQAVFETLHVDPLVICENTRNLFAQWMNERKYRVTGSICYGLYTYTKNKSSDWKKKCQEFIEPRTFKTEATEFGKKFEKEAREVFKNQNPDLEVIETGLIISKLNPWLAVSPDGVIIKNNKPFSLLEIKCPQDGKTKPISMVIENQVTSKYGCLKKIGDNIVMKTKHKYYGQIQLGMAVLNVNICHFIIHSPFDKSIFVLEVNIDKLELNKMLKTLKIFYFNVILPEVCFRESPTDSLHQHEEHYKLRPQDFQIKVVNTFHRL